MIFRKESSHWISPRRNSPSFSPFLDMHILCPCSLTANYKRILSRNYWPTKEDIAALAADVVVTDPTKPRCIRVVAGRNEYESASLAHSPLLTPCSFVDNIFQDEHGEWPRVLDEVDAIVFFVPIDVSASLELIPMRYLHRARSAVGSLPVAVTPPQAYASYFARMDDLALTNGPSLTPAELIGGPQMLIAKLFVSFYALAGDIPLRKPAPRKVYVTLTRRA